MRFVAVLREMRTILDWMALISVIYLRRYPYCHLLMSFLQSNIKPSLSTNKEYDRYAYLEFIRDIQHTTVVPPL